MGREGESLINVYVVCKTKHNKEGRVKRHKKGERANKKNNNNNNKTEK